MFKVCSTDPMHGTPKYSSRCSVVLNPNEPTRSPGPTPSPFRAFANRAVRCPTSSYVSRWTPEGVFVTTCCRGWNVVARSRIRVRTSWSSCMSPRMALLSSRDGRIVGRVSISPRGIRRYRGAARRAVGREGAVMPRYLLLIYGNEQEWTSRDPEDQAAEFKLYGEYTDWLRERGWYQAGEAIMPTATATSVRV